MEAALPVRVTGVGSSDFRVLQKLKNGLEFNNLAPRVHPFGGLGHPKLSASDSRNNS